MRAENIFWPPSGTVNGAKIGADGRLGDHYPQIWKPVIGAINGWAAGAGFYLMLTSTDIRLACAEHARFKFALLSQGWVGNGPGATYLTRQIAYADAMRILLTDEPFDAHEALRINLINEVVAHDRLMERAEEIAQHIAALPPVAVRMMKEFAIRFREMPVTEAWRVQTLMNTLLTQLTTDGDEGRQALPRKTPAPIHRRPAPKRRAVSRGRCRSTGSSRRGAAGVAGVMSRISMHIRAGQNRPVTPAQAGVQVFRWPEA